MKTDTKSIRRLVLLSLFAFLLFSFILIQFYKIQVVEKEKWTKLAKAQHQFSLIEPFKRGRFFANTALKQSHPRNPQILVFDLAKFHLYIDPSAFPEQIKEPVIGKIFEILALPSEEKDFIRLQFYRKSKSRKLKMWLENTDKEKILNWWTPYAREKKIPSNALYFVEDFQRSFSYGKLLGSVLGGVCDNRSVDFQHIPIGGLEFSFHAYLKGKPGRRFLFRSPRQSLESGALLIPPEDGADVYLTIEPYLQAIVEEEIERAVCNAGAKGGWAILMDSFTGEIYALGQYPSYEPSRYREYFNDPEKIEWTKVRAVHDCFEPGSVFKPFSLAIALLANEKLLREGKRPLFNPMEMIPLCDGLFPGRKKPIRDVGHHRCLNMYLALQKSSNIYVALLIEKVVKACGEDWYREQLSSIFGFGKKTGIELPGESMGFLPKPGKLHPSGYLEWSTPTPYSLAIGYNLLVNSLQMIRAYAIIANGGYDVKPTLIKKIIKQKANGQEEILLDRSVSFSKTPLLHTSISQELVYALKSATKPGGCGSHADIPGYSQAGKTGTTEKIIKGTYSKKHHFSSFIGFAPTSYPRFVLLVSIDEPEYRFLPGIGRTYFGGKCAAPAFRAIMERVFRYLGIPPDDPFGYPVGDPRRDKEKADWTKEIEMLKKLYEKWN